MVTTKKKVTENKRKKLYTEILVITAKYCKKELPTKFVDCLSTGPGTKFPVLLCTFLFTIKALTDHPLSIILYNLDIDEETATKAAHKWMKYYNEVPVIKEDVILICELVREKYSNQNKAYE